MHYSDKLSGYSRNKTSVVTIGNLPMGGDFPIRIQSMTNTNTLDTIATVEQSILLADAGCEYVRITAPGMPEAENFLIIKKELHKRGYNIPLIADVHFNPAVAEFLARHVEKVRINPGNYADKKTFKKIEYSDAEYEEEIERISKRFSPLVKICKEYGTAMRIGVNHGSLSDRIMSRFGDTPEGMVESAMDFIRICRDLDFHNIVLSMKSSNPLNMIHACRLLVSTMNEQGMNYPLHLGVTEAGEGIDGRIRSAMGIGALLEEGIGDTIRVSLTENPVNEIPVAKIIVGRYANRKEELSNTCFDNVDFNPFQYSRRETISVENIGKSNVPIVIGEKENNNIDYPFDYFSLNEKILPSEKINFIEVSNEDVVDEFIDKIKNDNHTALIANASKENTVAELRQLFFKLMQHNCLTPIIIKCSYENISLPEFIVNASIDSGTLLLDGFGDGIWLNYNEAKDNKIISDVSFSILQASRTRISQTEYISCPTCGRTSFDIQPILAIIKEKTKHLKGLKIAVMGCVVNGPGEMADADYGLVGNTNGNINLYQGKNIIKKNISPEAAPDALLKLIQENGD
jgi:(E)-4-hydroxy-3-methylbut-2-enyl-diphosphate synthase